MYVSQINATPYVVFANASQNEKTISHAYALKCIESYRTKLAAQRRVLSFWDFSMADLVSTALMVAIGILALKIAPVGPCLSSKHADKALLAQKSCQDAYTFEAQKFFCDYFFLGIVAIVAMNILKMRCHSRASQQSDGRVDQVLLNKLKRNFSAKNPKESISEMQLVSLFPVLVLNNDPLLAKLNLYQLISSHHYYPKIFSLADTSCLLSPQQQTQWRLIEQLERFGEDPATLAAFFSWEKNVELLKSDRYFFEAVVAIVGSSLTIKEIASLAQILHEDLLAVDVSKKISRKCCQEIVKGLIAGQDGLIDLLNDELDKKVVFDFGDSTFEVSKERLEGLEPFLNEMIEVASAVSLDEDDVLLLVSVLESEDILREVGPFFKFARLIGQQPLPLFRRKFMAFVVKEGRILHHLHMDANLIEKVKVHLDVTPDGSLDEELLKAMLMHVNLRDMP